MDTGETYIKMCEKLANEVIEWLKPYLIKGIGIGCYTSGGSVLEWVICDKDGDVLDEPNFTLLEPPIFTIDRNELKAILRNAMYRDWTPDEYYINLWADQILDLIERRE